MATANIGISVPPEMFDWLESNEGKKCVPNRSQVFQDAVNKIKNPTYRKTQPMSWLIMLMGMAFGIACLSAAMTMFFSFMFTATLVMLGGVVLLASLVTMVKEFRFKKRTH